MDVSKRDSYAFSESIIQEAITAYRAKRYSSIRATAYAFAIPRSTLQHRMAGRASYQYSRESQQILSSAEERTLIKWITHLTHTGYPISPALALELAETIRSQRYQLSKQAPHRRPIGKHWLDRFRTRYLEIQGVWTRQIESARYTALNTATVQGWFDAVTALYIQHQYLPERIYNMDESGFAIGASQSSRVLVNIRERSSWKVIKGRQEWITAVECVSAAGYAIPPLLIFKAEYTNTSWIPVGAPLDWRFSTSNSGWTSNSHAFEWIRTVFEPCTRPASPEERRLLIMDGHSSHITADFIAFCIDNAIDILILPPHCSHTLQPLDVSVFSPLKKALAAETDKLTRLDPGRTPRVEWTRAYIHARDKAITQANIQSGWKATGLWPLSPIQVLDKIRQLPQTPPPPPQEQVSHPLDLSLLASSPPDGTELREANALLHSELDKEQPLLSPAKRYTKRITRALETAQSEVALLRKRLTDAESLLQARKQRKKGKRIALKGKFVFSTQEVLDIAKQAELEAAQKKPKKKVKEGAKATIIDNNKEEDIEIIFSDSDSDCIVVAATRSS